MQILFVFINGLSSNCIRELQFKFVNSSNQVKHECAIKETFILIDFFYMKLKTFSSKKTYLSFKTFKKHNNTSTQSKFFTKDYIENFGNLKWSIHIRIRHQTQV